MKEEFIEVKCGNCRNWLPWKSFGGRSFVKKAEETGLDGKCCCYESGMEVGPKASWDTLSATLCNFYSKEVNYEKNNKRNGG